MGGGHHFGHLLCEIHSGLKGVLGKDLMIFIEEVLVKHGHVVVNAAVRRTAPGADFGQHGTRQRALLRILAGQPVILHEGFALAVKQFRTVAQQRGRDDLAPDLLRPDKAAGFKLLDLHIDETGTGIVCHGISVTDNCCRIRREVLDCAAAAGRENHGFCPVTDRDTVSESPCTGNPAVHTDQAENVHRSINADPFLPGEFPESAHFDRTAGNACADQSRIPGA